VRSLSEPATLPWSPVQLSNGKSNFRSRLLAAIRRRATTMRFRRIRTSRP
jgi:hypothetical protein